jgi:hypothetical protein
MLTYLPRYGTYALSRSPPLNYLKYLMYKVSFGSLAEVVAGQSDMMQVLRHPGEANAQIRAGDRTVRTTIATTPTANPRFGERRERGEDGKRERWRERERENGGL